MSVRVRDETPGDEVVELDLDLDGATFTAAELIRGRVAAELMSRETELIRPLVEPTTAELALNGRRRAHQAMSSTKPYGRSRRFAEGASFSSSTAVRCSIPRSESS
jgi:hypothetical protein